MRKNFYERGRLHMTVWRMRIECWIPKATNTHAHTQALWYLMLFYSNNGCRNAPQRYVICTFPTLFYISMLKLFAANGDTKRKEQNDNEVASSSKLNLLGISSWLEFWFASVFSKSLIFFTIFKILFSYFPLMWNQCIQNKATESNDLI
jgi:hypothetical protein